MAAVQSCVHRCCCMSTCYQEPSKPCLQGGYRRAYWAQQMPGGDKSCLSTGTYTTCHAMQHLATCVCSISARHLAVLPAVASTLWLHELAATTACVEDRYKPVGPLAVVGTAGGIVSQFMTGGPPFLHIHQHTTQLSTQLSCHTYRGAKVCFCICCGGTELPC
jgi:hypothetical protein